MAGAVAWQLSLRWARRRHQKERELVRRTRRAEKLAELGILTGGLAHEIRNPLSTIKMNLQLLSEDISHKLNEVRRSSLARWATSAGIWTGAAEASLFRRKTMPAFSPAGRNLSVQGSPENIPRPSTLTGSLIVF